LKKKLAIWFLFPVICFLLFFVVAAGINRCFDNGQATYFQIFSHSARFAALLGAAHGVAQAIRVGDRKHSLFVELCTLVSDEIEFVEELASKNHTGPSQENFRLIVRANKAIGSYLSEMDLLSKVACNDLGKIHRKWKGHLFGGDDRANPAANWLEEGGNQDSLTRHRELSLDFRRALLSANRTAATLIR